MIYFLSLFVYASAVDEKFLLILNTFHKSFSNDLKELVNVWKYFSFENQNLFYHNQHLLYYFNSHDSLLNSHMVVILQALFLRTCRRFICKYIFYYKLFLFHFISLQMYRYFHLILYYCILKSYNNISFRLQFNSIIIIGGE